MAKIAKTNAMRMLDKEKIVYEVYTYGGDEFLDGVTVAGRIGKPVETVFKTLVTLGASGEPYVFVVPVAEELDLKAAARAVGEKSISMLPVARITEVTGYVKGGCSPVGMKKLYKTVIDASAEAFDTIIFSAGKRGMQLEVSPKALAGAVGAQFFEITLKN